MKNKKVLLFDPDNSSQRLDLLLESQNWQVDLSNSFQSTQKLLQGYSYNVAISVIERNFETGFMQQLKSILSTDSLVNWILVLPESYRANNKISQTVDGLISQYCFDYHHTPVQSDRILMILGHAYGMAVIARNPHDYTEQPYAQFGIIGHSQQIKTLHNQISKVCIQDNPVLIMGETGTGKELVANAIHQNSARAKAKFIAVNCGSLTESLVQAELFGYEKGSFTGAHKRKIGRIEAAQGGTLFLDEIGDLPLTQQVNLLRFLQQKTIVRVGGDEEIPIDVRIIAATHINLERAVADGHFREDLYFRLKVLHITVPPLRERCEDVEMLARYFLQNENQINPHHNRAKGLSLGALQVIRLYNWPGNIRELANTIKRACIMSENKLLSPSDLGLDQRHNRRHFSTLEETRSEADSTAILGCLRQCNDNVTEAAKQLGVSRVTLHRLIEKYNLKVS